MNHRRTALLFVLLLQGAALAAVPRLTLSSVSLAVNEPVTVTLSEGRNPPHATDWIGLYEAEETPDGNPSSIWWRALPDLGITAGNGSFVFDPANINSGTRGRYVAGRSYKFIYAWDDNYVVLASVTFGLNTNVIRTIASFGQTSLTVPAGTAPRLPAAVTANFTDGAGGNVNVSWSSVAPALYARAGSFTVRGSAAGSGVPVRADVTVVEGSGPALTLNVLSDIHITADAENIFNAHFRSALADLSAATPNANALCVVGDLTDDGSADAYSQLMASLNSTPHAQALLVMGNHDTRWQPGGYAEALSRFRSVTGFPTAYYDRWIDGYHLIFLSGEGENQDKASLSDAQLAWLEARLADNARPERPIFVFLHQSLANSVPLTALEDGYGGTSPSDGIVQDARLRSVLTRFPQAILVTGHTHMQLESTGNAVQQGFVMINDSACSYLWNGPSGGSQGLVIDVYPGFVLLKGRDFSQREWVLSAQWRVSYGSGAPVLSAQRP